MLGKWLENELMSREWWYSAEMACETTIDILLHLHLHGQA
jgi:hypothetical protein